MERLPNRYPKISQSHKVPLYKGLSLFYPKLVKNFRNACVVEINVILSYPNTTILELKKKSSVSFRCFYLLQPMRVYKIKECQERAKR